MENKVGQKNAVITGTGRGIGKALVYAFAEAGYNIWACARTQNAEWEEELSQLSERTGIWIKPVYFDLSEEEAVKAGVKSILKEKLPIDVLINNAGAAHGGLLNMTSISRMREIYEINVFAQVQIIQLISRQMMKHKKGVIINMCSVGGMETNPGYLAHGSSKAALIWITKSLSKELADYNIRVNGIAPGLIDTDMGNYKSQEEIDKVLARTAMHRMGKTEEVAKAALYLASEEASYVTGHIMVVDGGRL
ncbi:MAG: SDR family oxidoreductase [Lachnospira sp.]|nr:SDR family oxidoreductase [Lachnospira sp.]